MFLASSITARPSIASPAAARGSIGGVTSYPRLLLYEMSTGLAVDSESQAGFISAPLRRPAPSDRRTRRCNCPPTRPVGPPGAEARPREAHPDAISLSGPWTRWASCRADTRGEPIPAVFRGLVRPGCPPAPRHAAPSAHQTELDDLLIPDRPSPPPGPDTRRLSRI